MNEKFAEFFSGATCFSRCYSCFLRLRHFVVIKILLVGLSYLRSWASLFVSISKQEPTCSARNIFRPTLAPQVGRTEVKTLSLPDNTHTNCLNHYHRFNFHYFTRLSGKSFSDPLIVTTLIAWMLRLQNLFSCISLSRTLQVIEIGQFIDVISNSLAHALSWDQCPGVK